MLPNYRCHCVCILVFWLQLFWRIQVYVQMAYFLTQLLSDPYCYQNCDRDYVGGSQFILCLWNINHLYLGCGHARNYHQEAIFWYPPLYQIFHKHADLSRHPWALHSDRHQWPFVRKKSPNKDPPDHNNPSVRRSSHGSWIRHQAVHPRQKEKVITIGSHQSHWLGTKKASVHLKKEDLIVNEEWGWPEFR